MESKIELFKSLDNKVELKVTLDNESVWLNRQQLSILFDRDIKTIGKHINNIFSDGELEKKAVVANFATTALDGKTYQTDYYNLDVAISVGYRVKSQRGVQFRQWASQILKEYLVQGYTINQKHLQENKSRFLKTLEDLNYLLKINNLFIVFLQTYTYSLVDTNVTQY